MAITDQDIIIYISCHDDESEQMAKELAESELLPGQKIIVKNSRSVLFENQTFDYMAANRSQWQNKRFVGLVSYKYKEKTFQIPPNILEKINQDEAKSNMYYIAHCIFQKKKLNDMKLSLANASTIQHSVYFLLAWMRLGSMFDIPEDILLHIDLPFFAYNYWIADIPTLTSYLEFYSSVKHLVFNDDKLKQYLNQNSLYDGKLSEQVLIEMSGKPYYTIHPFLFERLPGLFSVLCAKTTKLIGFVMNYPLHD